MSEHHTDRERKVEDTVVPDFNYAEEIPAGVGRAGADALPDGDEDADEQQPRGSRDAAEDDDGR
ncbi:hypothetical protein [Actinocatenispora comari]|jgi:hypothetical protein|uniref:Uncharacterized protein n=1 Tax=Actinocatenispora comari TaxID=2807577 RepID=A0A8J4AET3_9ACTN|nr:hypothetical protein [Actinocatenispora comari]GIL27782.1 hypothetical protein NUM_30360 [Actinocatenispora comari]